MSTISDPVAGDAATTALIAALDILVEAVPGAYGRHAGHGTRLVVTGAALPTLNGVFCVEQDVDVEQVATLAETLSGSALPWCVQVRGTPTPALVTVAAAHGLTRQHRMPLMVRPAGTVRPPSADPAVLVARRITGAEDQSYVQTLAAGFEVPEKIFGDVMSAATLDAPGAAGYLLERHGEPVATGLGLLSGDHIGVYNIATPPKERKQGHARLMTEAILRDGFAAGASSAYLQPSGSGRPLYESLGFRTVETWTYLLAG